MPAVLAEPYQVFMVNYTSHGNGKDAGPDEDTSYGAAQSPSHDRPDAHYHHDTMLSSFGSPSTFITDRPLPRQPPLHFEAPHYGLPSLRDSLRQPLDGNESEVNQNTDHTYGQRPVLHSGQMNMLPYPFPGETADLGPYPAHGDPLGSHHISHQEYSHAAAPSHHLLHHRIPSQGPSSLPSNARISRVQDSGRSKETKEPIDLSFLNMPGLPERFPEPKVSKTRFGKKEDSVVVTLKEQFNLSWKQIAWFFPGRQPGTLQVRYCNLLKVRHVDWDDEKDAKLKQYIEEYEENKWHFISRKMGRHRISPEACRRRAAELEELEARADSAEADAETEGETEQSDIRASFQPITDARAKAASNSPNLKPPNSLSCPKRPASSTPSTSRTMFLQRTASALARRSPARAFTLAQRPFSSTIIRSDAKKWTPKQEGKVLTFEEIKVEDDLLPPGAKPGTIPTDVDQATGLERLELIGKMQGIDIFDMRPLDASRKGTLEDPIIVNSAGDEQYAGCTGYPVDSHQVNWLTVSRERPIERCMECGNVVKMNYIGPEEDPHAHDHAHDHGHHHPPSRRAQDLRRLREARILNSALVDENESVGAVLILIMFS
ncbi:uncharacterized protein N7515_007050 [Penicillium bovifimosum]|uniref:Cytochrome c oxidase subunit 4, mitochondrial n=1 Tax=Penicillium bovifimosum TaxID=126998 RepID=A0A9W9GW34_9EURO|nr:uncharacterized protein N7515_007050 [Penicillium bovifimosum]KAJ5131011.1 hypothetical protein N7515_007050 [Penicillium bovifimosum]